METTLALSFGSFGLIACDRMQAHSILVIKDDVDKCVSLSPHILMASTGEAGDTDNFAEFIAKNVKLYAMRNGYELSPSAAASFTRRTLADALRSRSPSMVNLLVLGYDKAAKNCQLFHMDYLAAKVELPFASHGYGGFFATSVMDKNYRADMTKEEAYELVRLCVKEVQERLILNQPTFQVKLVDADGIHNLPDISINASA